VPEKELALLQALLLLLPPRLRPLLARQPN
jgi:hypothetical protein